MYTFPIVEKTLYNINNIEHIHPRKQRDIGKILEKIPVISVFGSSTRWDCNEKSDLDLLLDIDEIGMTKDEAFRTIASIVNSDFDLLWKDEIITDLNDFQKENILDGSVKVYGK